MQEFWREGLFDDLDERYFRLINRAPELGDAIDWHAPRRLLTRSRRSAPSSEPDNVGKESYFDSMTHFDFKTLLPALLHVEDRVSMAHGLESRVPFVDHRRGRVRSAPCRRTSSSSDGQLKHALNAGARGRRSRTRSSSGATRWDFPFRLASG